YAFAPCTMVITVMSVATPIVSPSMVSDARSLCACRAVAHCAKLSRMASIGLGKLFPLLYQNKNHAADTRRYLMGLEALLLSLRRAAFAGYQGLSKKTRRPDPRSALLACCLGRNLLRCGTCLRLRVVLLAIDVSRCGGLFPV